MIEKDKATNKALELQAKIYDLQFNSLSKRIDGNNKGFIAAIILFASLTVTIVIAVLTYKN